MGAMATTARAKPDKEGQGPVSAVGTSTERVMEARRRHVARGVNTPPLAVARAEGARITDVDGKDYIDFAGGLGCQNLGHGFGPAVDAMRAQLDDYLHQCFMVGMYEPYI